MTDEQEELYETKSDIKNYKIKKKSVSILKKDQNWQDVLFSVNFSEIAHAPTTAFYFAQVLTDEIFYNVVGGSGGPLGSA